MILAPINLLGIDEQGIAYISGTKMKVRQIVIEKTVWDLTPESIQRGHEQLSMAQIYAALSYYYEHQDVIDAEIADWHSGTGRITDLIYYAARFSYCSTPILN